MGRYISSYQTPHFGFSLIYTNNLGYLNLIKNFGTPENIIENTLKNIQYKC